MKRDSFPAPAALSDDVAAGSRFLAHGAMAMVWVDAGTWLVVDGGELSVTETASGDERLALTPATRQRVRDGGARRLAASGWLRLDSESTGGARWHLAVPVTADLSQHTSWWDSLRAVTSSALRVVTKGRVRRAVRVG